MVQLPPPKWLIISLLVVAFVGFGDAAFLTAEHFRGVVPPCTTQGCELVLTSAYATLGPVPVSLLGVLYYGALIGLFVGFLESGRAGLLRMAGWLTSAGFAVSLGLVGLQLFVIHAICRYCMLSALSTTLLFGILNFYGRNQSDDSHNPI